MTSDLSTIIFKSNIRITSAKRRVPYANSLFLPQSAAAYTLCSPPAVLNSPHPNCSVLKHQAFPFSLCSRLCHSEFRTPTSEFT